MRAVAGVAVASLVLCLSAGCGGGGGGGDDEGDLSTATPTPVADESGLRTTCGVVADGALRDPVSTERGELAEIASVEDSNQVVIRVGGSEKVIQLLGLGSTAGFDNTAARKLIESYSSQQLYYFPVSSDCSVVVGDESIEVGNLVTADGQSINEQILDANYGGVVQTSGDCGQSLVATCYSGLGVATGDSGTDSSDSPGEVSDFLWKPDSESSYNPGGVSILLNPCNATVLVNGEEVRNYGGTNGRCITARSAKSGCSYGSNVKVEAIDQVSGKPFTFNGQPYITIPNGCDRTVFEGSGSSTPSVSCEVAPADFKYVPASDSCGGNAAIVTSGSLASYFSAQLRKPDGGDRLDEECSQANCSPYKVQNYIEGAGTKTACFGAPGAANLMAEVAYATIKSTGDDSDPARYCIPDPAAAVN